MDHLVCLFHGGKVKENGEFESMKDEVHFFSKPPTFDALLCRYRDKIGWEVSLKGRFDCGKGRASLVFLWIMQLGFTGHTMLATLIKKKRYIVLCKQVCLWELWAWRKRNGKWKI